MENKFPTIVEQGQWGWPQGRGTGATKSWSCRKTRNIKPYLVLKNVFECKPKYDRFRANMKGQIERKSLNKNVAKYKPPTKGNRDVHWLFPRDHKTLKAEHQTLGVS